MTAEQRRELLAEAMRRQLERRVRVSDAEVMKEFNHENTRLALDFVVFKPTRYGRARFRRKRGSTDWHAFAWLSRAEVDRYLASHERAVKKRYDMYASTRYDKATWVLARYLFIEKNGATQPDPNRAKAQSLRRQLAAGADFATLAHAHSDDVFSNYRGGLLDWRTEGHLGKGLEVSRAARKLKLKELSAVIEDRRGYHILRIEDRSTSALTYDQVKYELAEQLARAHYRDRQAYADARHVQGLATAGRKLSDMFERGAGQRIGYVSPALTAELLRRLRSLTPEQQRLMLSSPELKRLLLGKNTAHATTLPQPSTRPQKPRVKLPHHTPGSPELRPRATPLVREYGDFTRTPPDGPLARAQLTALFDAVRAGKLPDKVYKHDDQYVVVQITKRIVPDAKQWAEQAPLIRRRREREQAYILVRSWVAKRCRAYARAHAMSLQAALTRAALITGEQTSKQRYVPCATLSP